MFSGKAFMVAALLLMGAGAKASAVTPNSHNPVHCMAAFGYGSYWFSVGHQPQGQIRMIARGIYEKRKLVASGVSEKKAKVYGEALTREHVSDGAMDSLLKACVIAQDSDPNFRAQQRQLMQDAQAKLAAYNEGAR